MSEHQGSPSRGSGRGGGSRRVVVAAVTVALALGGAATALAVDAPHRLLGAPPADSGESGEQPSQSTSDASAAADPTASTVPTAPSATSAPGTTATHAPAPTKARRSVTSREGTAAQHAGGADLSLRKRTERLLRQAAGASQPPGTEAPGLSVPQSDAPGPATFRVSTFNVLGASHTAPGGNKGGRGWGLGSARIAGAVALLRSHDVDVVGLQEFERVQYAAFVRRTGGSWGVFPGGSASNNATRNSIAWRKDTWQLVRGATVAIPYFHGNRVPMPYVLLRHVGSGRLVYFLNVHNPATTSRWGNNERWRDVATARESALVRRLHGQGVPVVMTGDFNERTEAFCRLTASTPLEAANGGSSGGVCRPPGTRGIDWIFGTPELGFSGFLQLRSPTVRRVTDHPFVVSTATLGGGSAG